jgi:isopentenyldiphosphate isomerase
VSEELVQLVDRQGSPAGAAPRSECHGNPRLIHAVVHLLLVDEAGRLYLQKRARGKDIYPGRWDTGVGGHLAPGETPEQAVRREAREELGIELGGPGVAGEHAGLERLPSYIYSDETETEYVFPFKAGFSGALRPNPEEIEEGAFFTLARIHRWLKDRPEDFTPHFRQGFRRLVQVSGRAGSAAYDETPRRQSRLRHQPRNLKE